MRIQRVSIKEFKNLKGFDCIFSGSNSVYFISIYSTTSLHIPDCTNYYKEILVDMYSQEHLLSNSKLRAMQRQLV